MGMKPNDLEQNNTGIAGTCSSPKPGPENQAIPGAVSSAKPNAKETDSKLDPGLISGAGYCGR